MERAQENVPQETPSATLPCKVTPMTSLTCHHFHSIWEPCTLTLGTSLLPLPCCDCVITRSMVHLSSFPWYRSLGDNFSFDVRGDLDAAFLSIISCYLFIYFCIFYLLILYLSYSLRLQYCKVTTKATRSSVFRISLLQSVAQEKQ